MSVSISAQSAIPAVLVVSPPPSVRAATFERCLPSLGTAVIVRSAALGSGLFAGAR